MHRFTVWERDAGGGWRPILCSDEEQEAEAALRDWALDYLEEHGVAPRPGRDVRLTQDLAPRLDVEAALAAMERERSGLPGRRRPL